MQNVGGQAKSTELVYFIILFLYNKYHNCIYMSLVVCFYMGSGTLLQTLLMAFFNLFLLYYLCISIPAIKLQ